MEHTQIIALDYDSFGNIIQDTNPLFDMPFSFAGGMIDADIGLIRFGFREYCSEIGRWTAKDPILFLGRSTDLYGYCLNDPINCIDILGLEETTVDSAIKQALDRGDTTELETILSSVENESAKSAARAALNRLQTKASELIAKNCKGSINRVFPEQMRDKTLKEIIDLARSGDKAAQTAKKLLMDLRFKK